jgi:hypothetical protein
MNVPHSRPAEGNKTNPDKFAVTPAWAALVPALAFGLPILAFAIDYTYFGPVVRVGPFTVWTAAALGMAAYGAGKRVDTRPFLAGLCSAPLVSFTLLAGFLSLASLPIALISGTLVFAIYGAALICITFIYGRRWRALSPPRARGIPWRAGIGAGIVLAVAVPIIAQDLHDRHFARRLGGLDAADPAVRAQTLRSLVGSRFCWRACVRAICEARASLDAETVRAALGVADAELECEDPGAREWPG